MYIFYFGGRKNWKKNSINNYSCIAAHKNRIIPLCWGDIDYSNENEVSLYGDYIMKSVQKRVSNYYYNLSSQFCYSQHDNTFICPVGPSALDIF